MGEKKKRSNIGGGVGARGGVEGGRNDLVRVCVGGGGGGGAREKTCVCV